MSMKISEKIDKFYFIFATVIIILAAVIVMIINGIFSTYRKSQTIVEKQTGGQPLNEDKLSEAYKKLIEKKIVPLDTRF